MGGLRPEISVNGTKMVISRSLTVLVKTSNGEYIALGKVSFQFLGTTRVSSDADLVLVGICLPRLPAGGQYLGLCRPE